VREFQGSRSPNDIKEIGPDKNYLLSSNRYRSIKKEQENGPSVLKIGENIKRFDLYVKEPSRIKQKNDKFIN
jgi:hypothetical protein